MSDREIRAGLRYLLSESPELLAEKLGIDGARKFIKLATDIKNFAEHANGDCSHCDPQIFHLEANEIILSSAIIRDGKVISSCCKPNGIGHYWCHGRDWTETSCSCECHCFVKKYKKENLGI